MRWSARVTARAAFLVDRGQIELRAESVPAAPPGGMVVRVRAALTDGTDVKAYRRGHPLMPFPSRFGHEFAGDVTAIGGGVTTFAVGDAVMSVHSAPCGECFWCVRGEEELCESVMSTKILGAYADYIEVPKHILQRNAFHKPADVSYAEAAFLEPLSCVVHACDQLMPLLNATVAPPQVAVIGDGGFGILHAQVLQARGAQPLLLGHREERMAIARSLGIATAAVHGRSLLEVVRDHTDGRGADALVECTGDAAVWEQAPGLVRRGGVVSLFGGLPSDARVSFVAARLHYDEIKLISPFHFTPRSVRAAYDMLVQRTISVLPLISQTFSLDRIADAFVRLDRGEGIKFAIEP
jgi:L-iditol 2-dehydrogenase